MACCGGGHRANNTRSGKVPKASSHTTWLWVGLDGTVEEFATEIEARAYGASVGSRGNVAKRKA